MISVIMSTYQEPIRYLMDSMSSILNQTYKNIEFIIIIDDPDNRELIDYIVKQAAIDKRIRYSVNERNLGLTECLNRAKKMSKGEFVARMDADDISELDRLECQLHYMQKNDFDIVGCNIIDIDENNEVINANGTNYPTHDKTIKEYLKINSAIPHPTWMVRKKIYDKYDYIDFPACEDYEFLTRVAMDGYRLGNVKECKLKYRINKSGISSSKKVIQKTSFSYVRDNYKNNKRSCIDMFRQYLNSPDGLQKKKKLERYYNKSEQLKKYRKEKKRWMFFWCGVKILVHEPEGRHIVFNYILEKKLAYKYKTNY